MTGSRYKNAEPRDSEELRGSTGRILARLIGPVKQLGDWHPEGVCPQ